MKIINFKGTTAAVLNGHAVAGGFILACSTDYRFTMKSNYKYGLNEKILGFTLPPIPQAIIESKLKKYTRKILDSKKLLKIDDLVEIPQFIECSSSPISLAIKRINQSGDNKILIKNKTYEINLLKNFLTINEERLRKDFYNGWWSKKSIIARKKQMRLLKNRQN